MNLSVSCTTVVVPLYNKEGEVLRAIRSVLNQTYQQFQLIVVNDGSTDRGPQVVESISDPRIRLVHQANQGVSAARNRGIQLAETDLIALLDADDEWRPSFLAEIMRLRAKYPAASVFATRYLYCDDGVCSLPRINGIPLESWDGILEDYFGIAATSDPPLWSSAVALTRTAIQSVGGFPIGVTSGEDLLTWARLAVRCHIAYSTLPAAVFWRPASVNARPGRHDPAAPDVVGKELARLLHEADPRLRQSIRAYLAYWHKSRARIFLTLGERAAARRASVRGLRFRCLSSKIWCYLFLATLPAFLSKWLSRSVFSFYTRLNLPRHEEWSRQ